MENYQANNIAEKVTGNSVSDHCTKNIYIKVFLKIANPWILVTSKILYLNITKFA